jgi:hypothetical protein
MGLICCPEMLVEDYHLMPRNIPEKPSFQGSNYCRQLDSHYFHQLGTAIIVVRGWSLLSIWCSRSCHQLDTIITVINCSHWSQQLSTHIINNSVPSLMSSTGYCALSSLQLVSHYFINWVQPLLASIKYSISSSTRYRYCHQLHIVITPINCVSTSEHPTSISWQAMPCWQGTHLKLSKPSSYCNFYQV